VIIQSGRTGVNFGNGMNRPWLYRQSRAYYSIYERQIE